MVSFAHLLTCSLAHCAGQLRALTRHAAHPGRCGPAGALHELVASPWTGIGIVLPACLPACPPARPPARPPACPPALWLPSVLVIASHRPHICLGSPCGLPLPLMVCCTTFRMKVPEGEVTGKRQALNGSRSCDHRPPRTSTPGLSRVRGAVSRLHVVQSANGPIRPTRARV